MGGRWLLSPFSFGVDYADEQNSALEKRGGEGTAHSVEHEPGGVGAQSGNLSSMRVAVAVRAALTFTESEARAAQGVSRRCIRRSF